MSLPGPSQCRASSLLSIDTLQVSESGSSSNIFYRNLGDSSEIQNSSTITKAAGVESSVSAQQQKPRPLPSMEAKFQVFALYNVLINYIAENCAFYSTVSKNILHSVV